MLAATTESTQQRQCCPNCGQETITLETEPGHHRVLCSRCSSPADYFFEDTTDTEPLGHLDQALPEPLKATGVRMFHGRGEEKTFLPQVFIKGMERRPYTFLGVLKDGPLAGYAVLARNRRFGYDPVGVHTLRLDQLEPCDRSFFPV